MELYTIYKIVDLNYINKVYVGKTNRPLRQRLSEHRYDAKRSNCSSGTLDLYKCVIVPVEENVHEDNLKDRERYWIRELDGVNTFRIRSQEESRIAKRDYARNTRRINVNIYQFLKILEEY
tara:strand:- start:539 stop:901 length:363 start_codon:yes stop_codon:yes gene_type:complete